MIKTMNVLKRNNQDCRAWSLIVSLQGFGYMIVYSEHAFIYFLYI